MNRVDMIGLLPQYVFERRYENSAYAVNTAVSCINSSKVELYKCVSVSEGSYNRETSHRLVQIVRFIEEGKGGKFYNAPVSVLAKRKIRYALKNAFLNDAIKLWSMISRNSALSGTLEIYACHCFLSKNIVTEMCRRMKELTPPLRGAMRCVLEIEAVHPTDSETIPPKSLIVRRKEIRYRVLYEPCVFNFPLVDAFFFVDLPTTGVKFLVGVQATIASQHHTNTSTVIQFKKRMADTFEGWEEYSKDLSWEIIYVQHRDSTPITVWQRCNISQNNEEHEKAAEFWNSKVRQYQVAISADDMAEEAQSKQQ